MKQKPTILVLGASGRFGRNGVAAFTKSGWNVRKFDRKKDDLLTMAKGADVILNGWNPAYPDWARQVPVLTTQVIKAAKASGATVLLPGNVYNFGVDAPEVFKSTTPHAAKNELGKIRIEMEKAYKQSGVQTIILRAGDFLDTEVSGNWFDLVLAKKLDRGVFTYPGNTEIPHAFAYLPDLLRGFVELAENRANLSSFEDIPFPGYTMTGSEMHAHIENILGQKIKLKRLNWLPLKVMSPFLPMMRRLVEMSYLWNKPHRIDDEKFTQVLPDFQTTPLDQALANAISFNVNPNQTMVRAYATV